MAVVFPDTEIASNIDHSTDADAIVRIINLRQHSLHAVINRNKLLWRPPQKWTQAHLEVLCVDRQSNADRENGLSLEAMIPKLYPESQRNWIGLLTKRLSYVDKAVFMRALLGFDHRRRPGCSPHRHLVAVTFYTTFQSIVELVVGQRAYRLPPLYSFYLRSLVFVYLDSHYIDNGWPAKGSPISNDPYEPCITGVLIAMAQKKSSSANGSSTAKPAVIETQLLFTHSNDTQNIYVYKAYISQRLLDRFRHPNQPPTSCSTSSLIKLQHIRVPYKPNKTFRCRLLAAVSVSASAMDHDDYFDRPKQESSPTCEVINPKRQRRDGRLRKL